jgi:hypothetical protein
MVGEKVRRILVSRGAPFTDEEMEDMSDQEGWAWIYASRPPKQDHDFPEIFFTGFGTPRKAELQAVAKNHGFKCVTCVTKSVTFLCTGKEPGQPNSEELLSKRCQSFRKRSFLPNSLVGRDRCKK